MSLKPTDHWSDEQLFFDGDLFFDDLIRGVNAARETIELETYIFRKDQIGRLVEEALLQARIRGVQVRLLVDGFGSSAWIAKRNPLLEAYGTKIRVYHPLEWTPVFVKAQEELGVSPSKARARGSWLSRLNRRDHRKVCVVDGRTAWVGSMNITDSHSTKALGTAAWKDCAIRVSGPAIQDLIRAFDTIWRRSHVVDGKRHWRETLTARLAPRPKPSPLVRNNDTRKLRRSTYKDLLNRIRSARQRIWITNAYLAPSGPIIRALGKAASRGLDVRLLVPSKSDVFFMRWVATSYYPRLIKAGVRIFEYLPRFLHTKSLIIDEWAMVGTTNLNRRSLMHDFEVDIATTHQDSLRALSGQFLTDLDDAKEVRTIENPWRAFVGRLIAELFKEFI